MTFETTAEGLMTMKVERAAAAPRQGNKHELEQGHGPPLLARRPGIAGLDQGEFATIPSLPDAPKGAQFALPPATEDVAPFKVDVPQALLEDLRQCLSMTPWPDRETASE